MVKLRLFSSAETEMEQFGDMDSPDLYHEYYVLSAGAPRQGFCNLIVQFLLYAQRFASSALTLLVGWQEGHPV